MDVLTTVVDGESGDECVSIYMVVVMVLSVVMVLMVMTVDCVCDDGGGYAWW